METVAKDVDYIYLFRIVGLLIKPVLREHTVASWPEMIITRKGSHTQLAMDCALTAVASLFRGLST